MNHHAAADEIVDELASVLHDRIGLRPEPTLRNRLRRCIRDEAAARNQTLAAYLATVLEQPNAVQRLVDRVTVQETAFFRHTEQFDVLARHVLPRLPQPVRIWSAACANGQESYSLAMLLVEQGIPGTVIATDLSTVALQRTTAATYSDREISGLSAERVARHLTRSGIGWLVNDAVRERVKVAHHNLTHPLPNLVSGARVVFCRNVLIYFSAEHTRGFLDRLADTLPDDAYLFLGSAETTWPVSDRFAAVRIDETFVYRRRPEPRRVSGDVVPLAPARSRHRAAAVHAAARPTAPSPRRSRQTVPEPVLEHDAGEMSGLAQRGQRALEAGDVTTAVVEFRKWAYLDPDDVVAHLHLGLALEATGDAASAARAYGAAKRLAAGANPAALEQAIDGYSAEQLLRMLDDKVASL